jgi:hypothetical protein
MLNTRKSRPSETRRREIATQVQRIVGTTPVIDIHTHLYDPAFERLLLWGLDEMLVYHYLVAESFRFMELPFEEFWALPQARQAELVWKQLFLDHSPVSEACRGVITTLQAFGLDPHQRDLPALRQWFARRSVDRHITECMELAGVRQFYMTNSPFDDLERPVWDSGFQRDERFASGLRIDPLQLGWEHTARRLAEWGYPVRGAALNQKSFTAVRRFLADWTRKMAPRYCMVSLPPDFPSPPKQRLAHC